jgi:tetratricopeptide (TPR) repeat protein
VEKAKALADKRFRQVDSAPAHLIVGSVELLQGNHAKAVEELQRAAEMDPKLPTVHSQLGYAYVMMDKRDLAVPIFQAELALNPDDYNASALLGWIYREAGKVEDAAPLLERALTLSPNNSGVLFQLAQIAQSKGATADAAKLLEQVVVQRPDFTQAHVLLSRMYFLQKRLADAQRERQIVDRLNAEERKKPVTARDLLYSGFAVPTP